MIFSIAGSVDSDAGALFTDSNEAKAKRGHE